MLEEIQEIPERAHDCLKRNQNIQLPIGVPYLGMGSSYFAAIALKYLDLPIRPEVASEYAYFLADKVRPEAVLISQSGYSSETLWNVDNFRSYVAIVNDTSSPLAVGKNCSRVIDLCAGEERHSATKTYINTLVALYQGFGIDPSPAVNVMTSAMNAFEDWGESTAHAIQSILEKHPSKGLVVLGSGANFATAQQAALILTETTHRPVVPMSVTQYDHGPKEAAANSIVLVVNSVGPTRDRTRRLVRLLSESGAICHEWDQTGIPSHLSPLTACIPFFFLAGYLSKEMGISNIFNLGNKITRVDR